MTVVKQPMQEPQAQAGCCPPQARYRFVTWPFGPTSPQGGTAALALHRRFSTLVEELPPSEPLMGMELFYAFDGAEDVRVSGQQIADFIGNMLGGAFVDVPNDGRVYTRQYNQWVPLSPIDGGTF